MLEIAELNSKTSNNSIKLVVAALIVSVTRLAAIALVVFIAATSFKLAAFAVPIIAASLKYNAYKAIKGRIASNAS